MGRSSSLWRHVLFAALAGAARPAFAAAPAAAPQEVPSQAERVHLELDHANVAVADLGPAAHVFQEMGFTIKPGRPHANSIANQHLKFLDGTEVELITATEPRDGLAEEYIQMWHHGDGGAFVALRSHALDSLAARLARTSHPAPINRPEGPRSIFFSRDQTLHPVWFFEVLRPWIDRPEYTTHANTALALRAAWLSSQLYAELVPVLAALGYEAHSSDWPVPQSTIIALEAGEIYLVPLADTPSQRPLLGVTIAVQRLESVESALANADVDAEPHSDPRGRSLRVRPAFARGLWLEFLEPRDPGMNERRD